MPLEGLIERHNLKITGVLHIGGHQGEEAVQYAAAGIHDVVWVEADPTLDASLRASVAPYRHRVISAAVADCVKDVVFHRASNGQSSSILELGTHATEHPDVTYVDSVAVRTTTIARLVDEYDLKDLNLWELDIQGAEGFALIGAGETLSMADYIYAEVNARHLYQGCHLVDEIDAILHEFTPVQTSMTRHQWGDRLYVRASLL